MGKNKSSEKVVPKFKFQKHLEVGAPDAETDRILMDAFIENSAVSTLLDMDSQRSILIGRTGSGKSAVLKYLENTQTNIVRINPEEMSLRYLANSTIIKHFEHLGVNLTFFYKVLWKHVFIVELLKLYFGDNEVKKQNFLEQLTEKIKSKIRKVDPRREKALNYLKNLSNDFWASTEKRIRELERALEHKFIEEAGVDFYGALKAKDQTQQTANVKEVTEVRHKAERIVNESQAEEIFGVLRIMEEDLFTVPYNKRYFIIIDDLDKDWIPSDIRYDLIGSMIEVIKEFQAMRGVKIVISLRDNLFQLVFSGSKHKGGQREKFRSLYVDLEWSEDELRLLLEKRLEVMSGRSITIKSAFEKIYRGGKNGFEYMLERTFLRPRDVISFVNHAIENADNKTYFTLDIIKKAEIPYSIERLQAIEDEWGENYGDLRQLWSFLIAKYNGFRLKSVKEDEFMAIYVNDKSEDSFKGDLAAIIKKWKNDEVKFSTFLKEVIFLLYHIGILGIKKGPNFTIQYSYEKGDILTVNDLNNDCKIYVHKTFYSALKINTRELESE